MRFFSIAPSSLAGLEDRCPWRLYLSCLVICICDRWIENPVLRNYFAIIPRTGIDLGCKPAMVDVVGMANVYRIQYNIGAG